VGSRLPERALSAFETADEVMPAYSVRVSDKARCVRLVLSERDGLVVVVPRGFDRRRIPAIVESKRGWVGRAQGRMDSRRQRLEAGPRRLPERITLAATGEEWTVEYRWSAEASSAARLRAAARPGGGRLTVSGPEGDAEAARLALLRWLRWRARETLPPRLADVAGLRGFSYRRVSVRQQRTRWASCSRRGTVSLNVKLLFLEPAVVDHILLHELCHTVEADHSPRFWALLEAHDADCALHRRRLRGAWGLLPAWLDGEVEPAGL
jgi:predicted metal-dependent hydrolase